MGGRRLPAGILPALLVAVALWALPTSALATPTHPSEREIDRARQAEDAAADAVAVAEARLAEAREQRDQLRVEVASAVEAYNGAQIALEEAQAAEVSAQRRAEATAQAATQARARFGQLAAASYRNGGQMSTVGVLLEAERTDQFVDRMDALRTATRVHSNVYTEATTTAADAQQAADEAAQALTARKAAADEAARARDAALVAVEDQEARLQAAEAEQASAVAELAAARGTTLALEQERQEALEAARAAERQRLAEVAELSASEAAEPVEAAEGPQPPEARSDPVGTEPSAQPRSAPAPGSPDPGSGDPGSGASAEPSTGPTPTAPPDPDPDPEPDPRQESPPVDASAAEQAIAYARDQVGKPYQWGGEGPDSFDCSGLVMQAWRQGDVSLPHWSAGQARATTRVSYAELQAGDLVFWSTDGSAAGTYHVGLYIGDGQMIHAPRPGKDVEIQSIFYWRTPSFYGRV